MRELLIVTPFDFVLVTSAMIVVRGTGSILKHFLIIKLLSLTEPSACGFSPSVIEIEEAIIKMLVRFVEGRIFLIKACRHVAFIVKIIWSNLCNMHVHQKSIVTIDLEEFIF